MRRFVILVILILMCLAPASLADESELPICAGGEFRDAFNAIVEHQLLIDEPVSSMGDLQRLSAALLEKRRDHAAQLPICADAIAIQRLLIQLGGDFLARSALEFANLPASENPYLLRLPDAQARIKDLLSTMLGIDRSDAPPPAERDLPACAPDDMNLLADAAAAFLELEPAKGEGATPAETIDAIDRLLHWREVHIPPLPLCAESIDLIQALSAASTDSATAKAFSYGGVSAARNPFPPLLDTSIATVTSWLKQWSAAVLSQAAGSSPLSARDGRLPPCAPSDLPAEFKELRSEYFALLERADAIVDLADYGEAQIAFRESRLANLPNCEEAFALRWFSAETLADFARRDAVDRDAPAATIDSLSSAIADSKARAESLWVILEDLLADAARRSGEASAAAAPECSDADHVFLFSYLVPEFWEFTDAALMISQAQDVAALADQSYALRQLLWTHLPRCDDALEIGLLMRAIAADTNAMLRLELAGVAVGEIPYLQKIARDMDRLFDWIGEFFSTCGGINGATLTYFVIAENIANVRACASTNCSIVTTASRGQRLDVVDDLSNWYEIVLPNCETAYIAGFLASQTPPGR